MLIFVQVLIIERYERRIDSSALYQVKTGELNQAVKRNLKRFPPDFMFQLSAEEVRDMMSQFVISSKRKNSAPPFAFTEQGIAMLSGVLRSDIAIEANIVSSELKELRSKVDLLALQREEDLGAVNDLSEDVRQDIDNLYMAIADLSSKLEEKKNKPRRKIGFQQNIED